ncbi:MarR family transcriptional regulator [Natronolimnohabitans sp. A-GB9]|uniref:MarR family transcriptional regulator n=1 Tax=Natronolimnohabitans sp. A-GB9 TaxID=3069757 RepID=UPI0027AED4AE|nr:MarR family transcriptional regulator [Natronolimnohabitans sp. A-GB9]MDQ2052114.1 MarR family transcriptional regulator [Natronolimnohabitans sp. A-GB9]
MSSQEYRLSSDVEPVPDELESAQAKLVYLCLEATGGATVDDLGEFLAMEKLSVLTLLQTLSNAGLIEQRGEEYVVTRVR